MAKEEVNECIKKVFTLLMTTMINPDFSFPGGGIAQRNVNECVMGLRAEYGEDLSRERIIDFCIYQVYVISGFDKNYLRKWNASHSFGKKALERFKQNDSRRKYYQDRWLKGGKLSREILLSQFRDRKIHPQFKFIYPQYEESTKRRKHNTEAGFLICQLSTYLWTPFSPACGCCKYGDRCREITQRKYPELFRLRNQEFASK